MKHPEPPKTRPRPVVIRQAWMMTLADGTRHDMGYSFHMKEEDRAAYIASVLETYEPMDMRAAPIGDPEPVHVTEEQYELIQASRHGLRVG
jgi:hypothetical protein